MQTAKLISCATATPPANPDVVSQANMTETKTKDQIRNPTVVNSQGRISRGTSSLAPIINITLARAYLKKPYFFIFPPDVEVATLDK